MENTAYDIRHGNILQNLLARSEVRQGWRNVEGRKRRSMILHSDLRSARTWYCPLGICFHNIADDRPQRVFGVEYGDTGS